MFEFDELSTTLNYLLLQPSANSNLITEISANTSLVGLAETPAPKIGHEILQRLSKIESIINDSKRRINLDLISKGVFGGRLIRVPIDYYSKSIEERANILKALSTSQLCKSIVFENTECPHESCEDITNSKYYCVVVQYDAKFNGEALRDVIHSLRKPADRLSKGAFHFRLAPEEISDRLSGFTHNAVSPFGMRTRIPIVICSRIVSGSGLSVGTPRYIYLGGGEVDVKLGISIDDFVRSTNAIVGKISEAR